MKSVLPGQVLADARTLWNYHRLAQAYSTADVVLGLGSYDIGVAEFATQLFLDGRAKWLCFAGGVVHRADLLATPWASAEADVFGRRALKMGVDPLHLILEPHSQNTGENFRLSWVEFLRRGIDCRSMIVVTKPNMERRARATAAANLPTQVDVRVTSPEGTIDDYFAKFDPEMIINLMVGDLQRIELYPSLGYQAPESIPETVRAAFLRLVDAGFDKHLIEQVPRSPPSH